MRGPLTRDILIKHGYKCPQIYGDPAILMPEIYTPESSEKIYDCTLIHHHSYTGESVPGVNELSIVTNDYKSFIDVIAASKLVLSGSLHGIILAECYGVPAVLIHENGLDLTKYKDYYYSTGRKEFPVAESVEQALKTTPADLPDLRALREGLITSFPVDLFEQSKN